MWKGDRKGEKPKRVENTAVSRFTEEKNSGEPGNILPENPEWPWRRFLRRKGRRRRK